MTVVPAQQINGLMPGLDPKQIQVPHVLNGQNFLINLRGPITAFGGSLYNWFPFSDPADVQTLEYNTGYLYFATDGIYVRFANFPIFTLLYRFATPATEKAPWTSAFVGGRYYFCKKGMPIIQLSPTGAVKVVTTDVATGPVAVTQIGGRLVILAAEVVQWSAIDNGEDLAVDPDKGVGAQLLAIAGGGTPIMVKEVAQGFITYTTKGILFSQLTSSGTLPFRHRVLPAKSIPVSAFAIADIDRQAHIVLTDTGFYIVATPDPEPWQQLFGEYLRANWIPELTADPGAAQLHYDRHQNLLYVALNPTAEYRTYTQTFVNYLPRDNAWGSFDFPHVGLLHTPDGTAVMQADGYIFLFDETFVRQVPFDNKTEFAFHLFDIFSQVFFDDPAYYNNYMHFSVVNPDNYSAVFGHLIHEVDVSHTVWSTPIEPYLPVYWDEKFTDGTLFDDNEGFGSIRDYSILNAGAGYSYAKSAVAETRYEALNSEFTIGLFRLLDEEHIDRLADLYGVNVTFAELNAVDETIEDWNIESGVEDWNVLSAIEDWGVLGSPELQFTFEVFGSKDGREDWPYDNRYTPYLALSAPTLQMYQCDITGYYFGVTIKTNEIYSGAEIRALEFAANLGGRL